MEDTADKICPWKPKGRQQIQFAPPAFADFLAIMSTSIRNRLPGTIERIVSDNVVSELTIRTAAGDVTSIITTGSVKRMNLKVGDSVFAIIKATEVSIEK
jgi:molybdopterin-binding protein